MQPLARNGYTSEQVRKALHSPNRKLAFKYELLDGQNQKQAEIFNVISASVFNNSLAQIKRTASFQIKDIGEIDFLTNRIKPWVKLRMPDNGWAEFPLGVFILSTPPRKTNESQIVIREVEAYDLLQILVDDKIADRYAITQGTNYITSVKSILEGSGILQYNLAPTSLSLPVTRDWEVGVSKLQIINDLLGAINYRSLYFDENGIAIAHPYVPPTSRASEYTYADDDQSMIFPDMEQGLDLFNVPNTFVVVCSEPDRPVLVSTYVNDNQDSPLSTINRGRVITDFREEVEAADQASLDAIALRIAVEASQGYEQVTFYTPIMPMHSENDCLTLQFSALGISSKYIESSWEMPLIVGAKMKHIIRRVVNL